MWAHVSNWIYLEGKKKKETSQQSSNLCRIVGGETSELWHQQCCSSACARAAQGKNMTKSADFKMLREEKAMEEKSTDQYSLMIFRKE